MISQPNWFIKVQKLIGQMESLRAHLLETLIIEFHEAFFLDVFETKWLKHEFPGGVEIFTQIFKQREEHSRFFSRN